MSWRQRCKEIWATTWRQHREATKMKHELAEPCQTAGGERAVRLGEVINFFISAAAQAMRILLPHL